MGSDGYICMYSLPELKLVLKEDCVDSSDAVGQRSFTLSQYGLFMHLRSPSEYTRGCITEEMRQEIHFSIPCKDVSKFVLTQSTPKLKDKEPAEVMVCV